MTIYCARIRVSKAPKLSELVAKTNAKMQNLAVSSAERLRGLGIHDFFLLSSSGGDFGLLFYKLLSHYYFPNAVPRHTRRVACSSLVFFSSAAFWTLIGVCKSNAVPLLPHSGQHCMHAMGAKMRSATPAGGSADTPAAVATGKGQSRGSELNWERGSEAFKDARGSSSADVDAAIVSFQASVDMSVRGDGVVTPPTHKDTHNSHISQVHLR